MDVWWRSPDCIVFLLGYVPSPCLVCLCFGGVFHHHVQCWYTWPPKGLFITGGDWWPSDQSALPPPVWSLGASLVFSYPWCNAILRERSMASWTAWLLTSCLGQSVFITIFFLLQLKELIVLIKGLAEPGIIYPAISVWLSSDRWTNDLGSNSCRKPI